VRDPVEGNHQLPETFHPYQFANANPHWYIDPTGLFSLVEINVANSVQQNLQALRATAIHEGREYLKDKLYTAVQENMIKALRWLMPSDFQKTIDTFGARVAGIEFGKAVTFAFCKAEFLNDVTWSDAEVDTSGRPRSDGYPCKPNGPPAPHALGNRYPQPDFILSEEKPTKRVGGQIAKGYTIGDAKLRATTLQFYYQSRGRSANQWLAITSYARENTMSKTALFITYGVGPQKELKALKTKMKKDSAAKGINVVVIPLTKQKI
jgi:hypothetical protein